MTEKSLLLVDGSILKGITRDSIITILKHKGIEVEERPLSIDEVVEASSDNKLQEVFGTGTAAVIGMVKSIKYKDTVITVDSDSFKIAPMLKDTINKMRARELEDTFNWIVPAEFELAAV